MCVLLVWVIGDYGDPSTLQVMQEYVVMILFSTNFVAPLLCLSDVNQNLPLTGANFHYLLIFKPSYPRRTKVTHVECGLPL